KRKRTLVIGLRLVQLTAVPGEAAEDRKCLGLCVRIRGSSLFQQAQRGLSRCLRVVCRTETVQAAGNRRQQFGLDTRFADEFLLDPLDTAAQQIRGAHLATVGNMEDVGAVEQRQREILDLLGAPRLVAYLDVADA